MCPKTATKTRHAAARDERPTGTLYQRKFTGVASQYYWPLRAEQEKGNWIESNQRFFQRKQSQGENENIRGSNFNESLWGVAAVWLFMGETVNTSLLRSFLNVLWQSWNQKKQLSLFLQRLSTFSPTASVTSTRFNLSSFLLLVWLFICSTIKWIISENCFLLFGATYGNEWLLQVLCSLQRDSTSASTIVNNYYLLNFLVDCPSASWLFNEHIYVSVHALFFCFCYFSITACQLIAFSTGINHIYVASC